MVFDPSDQDGAPREAAHHEARRDFLCSECGGSAYDMTPSGVDWCQHCAGSGLEPAPSSRLGCLLVIVGCALAYLLGVTLWIWRHRS
jgi:hypothetical protein